MKLSLSICLVALTVTATAFVRAAAPDAGGEAPDFVLKSVAGSNIRLSEHRSEIVMLSFTASWCGECRHHEALLAELHSRYRDAGLVLLTVSLDKDRRGAESVANRSDTKHTVLHDARGETGRLYDIDVLPTLVLVDRSGAVRDIFEGYTRGDDHARVERVRAMLREL